MSEVRYSVNGKYFKDFGTYISSSEGLFDALKRKPVNTYDWAEYHGSSPDLSNPKFEQREITLKGFVTGSNWETMKSNFDAIVSEFQKAGTQRLLIEPFGLKPLPYEVCMIDEVRLQKEFKNGQMVGTFTLKLIEPNPIKKVLYFTGNTLNLSYDCPNETEIFYGNGLKETAKGNVSLSGKTLANRVLSGYNFEGRNLLRNSKVSNINSWVPVGNTGVATILNGELYIESKETFNGAVQYNAFLLSKGEYTVSYELKWTNYQGNKQVLIGSDRISNSFTDPLPSMANSEGWIKMSKTGISNYEGMSNFLIQGTGGTQHFYIRNIKIEKSTKATPYSPAPEDEKIIIIAGNVEDITNLTTNADVLWDKL